MDFQKLLTVANYNNDEAKYESSIKTYSTVLPPPKKPDKSTVQSDSIKRFLAKKKAEEDARAAVARKQKEKLLELRSQNSKNNKKAKIMASRTKDNDFSRIKLSEDEILSKKKIEKELQQKHLMDKKERMKVRIELEEKEKLLPRKRKRKSKNGEIIDEHFCEEPIVDDQTNFKNKDKNSLHRNGVHKPPRPPPPALSFNELLKVAEKKMHEPIVMPKKKEEERPMTKKERRLAEEERKRLQRKQELLEKGIEPSIFRKPTNNKKTEEKTVTKNPHVVHVGKDKTQNTTNEITKFKIPKSSNGLPMKVNDTSLKNKSSSSNIPKTLTSSKHQSSDMKRIKNGSPGDKIQGKSKEGVSVSKRPPVQENSIPKKSGGKIRPVSVVPSPRIPKIDTEALTADIERKVREKLEKQFAENLEKQIAADIEQKVKAKLEKEMAEKYRISLEEQRKKLNINDDIPEKVKRPVDIKKISAPINGKIPPNPGGNKLVPKKSVEKSVSVKTDTISQKSSVLKPPPKKTFHKNPYLEPPRRLLEPIIPQKKRPSRVIDDDDEDDDEDDDMSGFIDDGPSVEDENYSQYIKQIFGYDRSKYVDEDDDDIIETSYSEQMKEEMKSARLGYLEDLEEERKQKKEEMERKKKKMKLKK